MMVVARVPGVMGLRPVSVLVVMFRDGSERPCKLGRQTVRAVGRGALCCRGAPFRVFRVMWVGSAGPMRLRAVQDAV